MHTRRRGSKETVRKKLARAKEDRSRYVVRYSGRSKIGDRGLHILLNRAPKQLETLNLCTASVIQITMELAQQD